MVVNGLFIILLFFYTHCYVGLSIEEQCMSPSKMEKKSDTNSSVERSENSENSVQNEELICNTGPSVCAKSRYRTIDGSCNNLLRPVLGMPQTPYARLLPFHYGDGISSLTKSVSGHDLPNARMLRLETFPDKVIVDKEHSLITMQWGQIIVHDMSLTSGVPQTRKQPLTCCNSNGTFAEDAKTNPLCAPIRISRNDPIYASQGKICMDFIRTRSTKDNHCTASDVPAEPLTSVTAYMDLSLVYGHNKTQADAVRAGCGGRLLTLMRNGQEWPPQDPQAELACNMLMYPNSSCYLAGDIRVNQNPELALLQVILLREHNRITDALHKLNRHWNDEKLFQEARRILIAVHQRISYYEYLPKIIGLENMLEHKLIYLDVEGYINDYNETVDPSVYSEHASAAFRIFHSSIRGYLQKFKENRRFIGESRLSDSFNNPTVIEKNNDFDNFARGLSVQLQSYSDKYFDKEVTEYFFRGANKYGDDLRAIDIQRSRDQGLSGYVKTRAVCGLSVPKTYNDMLAYMSAENVKKLEKVYENLEDVELIVAGSLEYHVPKTQVGPTFMCIITKQFLKTRTGDRFFFENGADPEIAFTPSQLLSIRRGASISRLLCDNVLTLKSIQPRAFEKISHKNKIVPCDDLPFVDLSLWKEETS